MRVEIHLGEPYWRVVGARDVSLEMAGDARLGDLMGVLRQRWPRLGSDMDEACPVLFLDDAQADPGARLKDGSQIRLLWPVAGG